MMRKIFNYFLFSAVLFLIFSFNFYGCTVTSSDNVRTSGIWAYFAVDQDADNNVIAWGIFRVGGALGTIVELSSDDRLYCNDEEMEQYVELITQYHWLRAEIEESSNDQYTFTFTRPGEEINTSITMPPISSITATDPQDELKEGDSLTIFWDNSISEGSLSISVNGTCIDSINHTDISNTGEYIIQSNEFVIEAGQSSCDLTVSLTRTNSDSVNSAFQSGSIEAHATDSLTIPFEIN